MEYIRWNNSGSSKNYKLKVLIIIYLALNFVRFNLNLEL
jgi:hypothetical protein